MNEHDFLQEITRRTLFKKVGYGLGNVALATMLADPAFASLVDQQKKRQDPMAPKKPHHKPKAKSIIYLFMAGAPSTLDLFDYKPVLSKFDGDYCPD